jgi:hypothetical protein
MAEEHPPSPKREDDNPEFGRLWVKPAMTVKGTGRQSKKKHYGRIKKKTIVPGSH